jgi:hypothetical protein
MNKLKGRYLNDTSLWTFKTNYSYCDTVSFFKIKYLFKIRVTYGTAAPVLCI